MNEAPAPLSENRSVRSARFQNHLHRFKNQLRRRWWIVPLAVIVAVGIQSWRIWKAPVTYSSQGKMIMNLQIRNPTGGQSYIELETLTFFATQKALMESGVVDRRARARVRALKPDLKEIIHIKKEIGMVSKSSMFGLIATGEEPEYTTAYLDALMAEYLLFKSEMRGTASERPLSAIMSELADLEKKLRTGENELLDFQSSNSVVFIEEQGNTAAKHLGNLTVERAKLQSERQLLQSMSVEQNMTRDSGRPNTTDKSSASTDTLFASDSDYLQINKDLRLLRATQKELSTYFRPRHPKMILLSDRISQKERLLDIYKDQSLETLTNKLASISIQIESLDKTIAEWETRSLDSSRKMGEYQKIKSSNTRLQGLYDRLQTSMQTLSQDKEISPDTVAVFEPASPARPNTEDNVNNLLIAAGIGLVLAIILLLLLDRFDDRMTSFTDLQDIFDEPVLAQVPREMILNESGRLALIHPDDDRHAFAEAYRNLRSSLLYMGENGTLPKFLLVTSSIPGEGKSVTASNLGITLAEAGAKVLIVDGDLRKGTLHTYVDKPVSPGLTEVLAKEADWTSVVHATITPNLSVITRGRTARNPSELFLTPHTKNVIAEMKTAYDVVLMDSAPVMAADDVSTLAPMADGVVFVIRASFTSARIARAALDLLYQRRVNILGITLNAVAADSSEYYYYKYKSYYMDSPKRTK